MTVSLFQSAEWPPSTWWKNIIMSYFSFTVFVSLIGATEYRKTYVRLEDIEKALKVPKVFEIELTIFDIWE